MLVNAAKINVKCTLHGFRKHDIVGYLQKAKSSCSRTGCCFSWQRCKQSDMAAKTDPSKFPKTFSDKYLSSLLKHKENCNEMTVPRCTSIAFYWYTTPRWTLFLKPSANWRKMGRSHRECVEFYHKGVSVTQNDLILLTL